jgi:MoxR-like ATPase
MSSNRLTIQEGHVEYLPACGACPKQVHVYEAESIDAINAALAAKRPLLVRGEPGTGKSQLALAAAFTLKRQLLTQVVDGRTTARDLLWTFDAVARLAEAQLVAALREPEDKIHERLDEKRFISPGRLWWALDWASAEKHASKYKKRIPEPLNGCSPKNGTVLLIDEIDKADSDVPNGLLEILGSGTFQPQGYTDSLCMGGDVQPLIVITTNEERSLPDAFLRRCLVLHLSLPDEPQKLIDWLIGRGQKHFSAAPEPVLRKAAELLAKDRKIMQDRRLSPPGQAEYLDLIRALIADGRNPEEQMKLLDRIAGFALRKHPKAGSR